MLQATMRIGGGTLQHVTTVCDHFNGIRLTYNIIYFKWYDGDGNDDGGWWKQENEYL